MPRGEYGAWVSHDKHANAFAVLFDPRSQRIQRNRGVSVPAHEDSLCLKCHVSQDYERERGQPGLELADGVHCEACHGPAAGWLSTHYLPSWRTISDDAKAVLGFRPLKDLTVRANTCAECHVGSNRTGTDVNHDLIAAGHPRLNFEFANYLANYPRHWSLTAEKQRHPDFEARAWLIGQLVSARQALDLLAWRAEQASQNKAPWPEFAEYDCYACHRSLKGLADRPVTLVPGRMTGKPAWNAWYLALVPHSPGENVERRDTVRKLMSNLAADEKQVAEAARVCSKDLQTLLQQIDARPLRPDQVRELLQRVTASPPEEAVANWDSAAQHYLAATALYQALGDLGMPKQERVSLRQALEALRQTLTFPKGHDGPVGGFDPTRAAPPYQQLRLQLHP